MQRLKDSRQRSMQTINQTFSDFELYISYYMKQEAEQERESGEKSPERQHCFQKLEISAETREFLVRITSGEWHTCVYCHKSLASQVGIYCGDLFFCVGCFAQKGPRGHSSYWIVNFGRLEMGRRDLEIFEQLDLLDNIEKIGFDNHSRVGEYLQNPKTAQQVLSYIDRHIAEKREPPPEDHHIEEKDKRAEVESVTTTRTRPKEALFKYSNIEQSLKPAEYDLVSHHIGWTHDQSQQQMGIDLINQQMLESEERRHIYGGVQKMFELYKPDKSEYVTNALGEQKKTGVNKLKLLHQENREKKELLELFANCNEILTAFDKKEENSLQDKTEKGQALAVKRRKRGMTEEMLQKDDVCEMRSNRSGFQVKTKPIEKNVKIQLKEVEPSKLKRHRNSQGSPKVE